MIRAVIRGKTIEPLDPLPEEWTEGREVMIVEAVEPSVDPDPTWLEDMDRLTADMWTEEEWEQAKAELAEADEVAKAFVRRQMGLN